MQLRTVTKVIGHSWEGKEQNKKEIRQVNRQTAKCSDTAGCYLSKLLTTL